MTNRVKLDNVDHANLRVANAQGAAFGDAVNQLLVFPSEFEQLQREYPILFRRDEAAGFYAVVLLGLDLDENLFLGERGWTSRYVPAIRQRGPFLGGGGDDPSIHVDLADPRVGVADGEPLFLRHGGESPYLRHIAAVLEVVRRGAQEAAPFFVALADHGLIRPAQLEIAVGDGQTYTLSDVFTVDEDKLAALDDAALSRLHRSGVLRAATMAAASLGNIAHIIALQSRRADHG